MRIDRIKELSHILVDWESELNCSFIYFTWLYRRFEKNKVTFFRFVSDNSTISGKNKINIAKRKMFIFLTNSSRVQPSVKIVFTWKFFVLKMKQENLKKMQCEFLFKMEILWIRKWKQKRTRGTCLSRFYFWGIETGTNKFVEAFGHR